MIQYFDHITKINNKIIYGSSTNRWLNQILHEILYVVKNIGHLDIYLNFYLSILIKIKEWDFKSPIKLHFQFMSFGDSLGVNL